MRLKLVSGVKWGCTGKGAEGVNGLVLCVADRHKDPREFAPWDCLGTDVHSMFSQGGQQMRGLAHHPLQSETLVINLPFPYSSGELEFSVTF